MCRATVNDLFALVSVNDAGSILTRQGKEALFHVTETSLSKPGVKKHLEKNGSDIIAGMCRYSRDPNFDPEIAERFIKMVKKIHPATALGMRRHLPKDFNQAKKTEKKSR